MQTSARLQIPYLAANQAQKHVTHNEAIARIDVLLQASVVSRGLVAPADGIADGDVFLVAEPATDVWVGQDGNLAAWIDGAWQFSVPRDGFRVWISDEKLMVVHDGTNWKDVWSPEAALTGALGINTAAETNNRLAVKSDSILFSHDDVTPGSGDIRLQLNRSETSNYASILFSTEYAASVEMGLSDESAFSLKASPDGTNFTTLMTVDANGDAITLPQGAVFERGLEFTPPSTSDGQEILTLNIERAWQFEQHGSGSNTHLGLRCLSSGKSVLILNRERDKQIEFSPQAEEIRVAGQLVLHTGLLDPAALKTGAYNGAGLPSAAMSGAGAIVFVQDAAQPALAYSDGTAWRWIADDVIV